MKPSVFRMLHLIELEMMEYVKNNLFALSQEYTDLLM
jgi:hypothetical protein